MENRKIVSLEDLAAILKRLRGERKRIVQCHGVFDLLHVGHLRHFEQAKQLGDALVVTLTPDEFVNKGAGRPAFGQDLRAEFIAALACVDFVAINRWPAAVETIRLLRPHVFAKGSEFRKLDDTIGNVSKEEEAIRAVGGEMAFTDDLTYSSSALINQYLSQFPDQVRQYLDEFARRYSAEDVLRPLRAAETCACWSSGRRSSTSTFIARRWARAAKSRCWPRASSSASATAAACWPAPITWRAFAAP